MPVTDRETEFHVKKKLQHMCHKRAVQITKAYEKISKGIPRSHLWLSEIRIPFSNLAGVVGKRFARKLERPLRGKNSSPRHI